MDKAFAAARVRAAFGDAAGTADPLQRPRASSHGFAGAVFSAARLATRSKRRCRHFSGYEAGFGLTELLVSALLLGVFGSLGLRVQVSIAQAARQQHLQAEQQRWLAAQLQRDAGLLARQGALLAVDCLEPQHHRQGLQQLQQTLQGFGQLALPETFQAERQLDIVDDLLQVTVAAGCWQRQQHYSLQGLGACINEPD